MKDKRRFIGEIVLMVLLLLPIGACSTASKKGQTAPPASAINQIQPDARLFQEGFVLLGNSGKPADYGRSRMHFDQLIREYPQSKWRAYAEAYRQLLDDYKKASEQAARAQTEAEKAQQERESLQSSLEQSQKSHRLLQEKLNTETARLLQENEQLKGDLQHLKQLEIDLQRRSR